MKILRLALGVVVGAYGLFCLFPIVTNVAYKAGAMPHPDGDGARMAPLWAATPWWQLGVWAAIVGLFLAIAWRLIRGRPALGLYLVALVSDTALWWIMHSGAAYQQVFTPAEVQLDYDTVLGMAVVGAAIWWVERPALGGPASA
ncbi:hypothetical protein [Phenylobacterium sp.]|uniref:hypothetical protein n=1 Tax=Phenylobacterium sp. TaxID=1871053 RepID=UPI002DF3A5F9|nr:hypothetical protein [Phenylobacterium sp.]